jgi:hypothetical protein
MLINLRTQMGITLIVTSLSLLGCASKSENNSKIQIQEEEKKPILNIIEYKDSPSLTVRHYDDYVVFRYKEPSFLKNQIKKPNDEKYCWTITDTDNKALLPVDDRDTHRVVVISLTERSISNGIIRIICDVTYDKQETMRFSKEFTLNKQNIQRFMRADAIKARMDWLNNNLQIAKTDTELQNQIAKMKLYEQDSVKCFYDIKQLATLAQNNAITKEITSKQDVINAFLMQAPIYDKSLCTQDNPEGEMLGVPSSLDIQQETLYREARVFAGNLAESYKNANDKKHSRGSVEQEMIAIHYTEVKNNKKALINKLRLIDSGPEKDYLSKYPELQKLVKKSSWVPNTQQHFADIQELLTNIKTSVDDNRFLSALIKWNKETEVTKLEGASSYLVTLYNVINIIDEQLAV